MENQMNNEEKRIWLKRLAHRARLQAGKVLLLLVGGILGASIFALWSSTAPSDHTEHIRSPDQGKETIWTCSMHPQIRQPEPGQCPICGMDLIPVTSNNEQGSGSAGRIVLSERARALVKLMTAPVRRQSDATAALRLLGRVVPNETTLKTVTAWTGGRIDRLHVNVTGERVQTGQVIATLYSPEVFAAHQDLLAAKRQIGRMAASPEASRQAASSALDAARERLRLLGVPDNELAFMEGEARPTRAVAIRSPFSGTVIERLVTEGAYVSTGTPLYRVADLTTLWVQLDAYESDLSRLLVGQPVRISVEALPGEELEGEVTFVDPTVDARRRTAQIRVQIDNRNGRIRPGMFAEAVVAARKPTGDPSPLVVPATAPLFTGRRAVVYVETHMDDRVAYEPRTVRLGPRLGEVYPVVAGLSEGDLVVTRGAFALDADLQIRGGASMMTVGDDREKGVWDVGIELSVRERQKLAPIVSSYLSVQAALADDDLARTKESAAMLADTVQRVELKRLHRAQAAWSDIARALRGHARHVAAAGDLEGARQGFEPLSGAIITLLTRLGNPLDHPLRLAFCPMAAGGKGAFWVQRGADINNAYFGASMATCGEVRQEVEPRGFLKPLSPPATSERRAAPMGEHQH
jgi:Cu(I)/Ag(I) efflux system membrane fusion protein